MASLEPDVIAALSRQVPKLTRNNLEKETRRKFKELKGQMISEFLALPVTQEIMAGPNGVNISGSLGGVSNLFAFIGFNQGDDPIAPILTLLEAVNLQYDSDIKRSTRGFGVNFKVNLPLPEEIFAITPLPWATGRSWAEGIERGLSGLGHLLKKSKGRSGAAIQTRVKVRGGKFQNTPYISAFLKKYKQKFEQLK
jgi:hypothetical protein|tara:strand:- start:891 stop:1478 length:588 start_codon:yes stop_codon:yes gene_type:complete